MAMRPTGGGTSRDEAEGGEARSAIGTAARYAARATDPVRETRRILDAIAEAAGRSIFTLATADRAMAEAHASAARWQEGRPRGCLDGVAIAWKDLFDLAGEVTTAGSRVLGGEPAAERDADLVVRLAEAGAVAVGRVNMTEFAYSGLGLNPHHGTPVNPWSRDEPRVPGGSSSGSAVAVAAGLVPLSIGSDTGGSVRIPAAFNGIVGYKTSGGRWPLGGVFPLSRTLDTLGVFSRSVVDAVVVDAAARGLAAPDLRRGSLAGLRLIVPTNVVMDALEPAVLDNFEAALGRLALAGAQVERRSVPAFDAVMALNAEHGALAAFEAHALHRERIASEAVSRMDRRVVARLRGAATIPTGSQRIIRETRTRLVGEAAALFDDHTLVAFPTVPHVAPAIAALEGDDALFVRTNTKTLRNTMLGNMLDWCGISIPSGFGEAGLPTGLLLSGGPGRDDHVLATALAAEDLIRGAADFRASASM